MKQRKKVSMPITALAELLVQRGVLTESERESIKDLATLAAVSEAKTEKMSTTREHEYLLEAEKILSEGHWVRKRLTTLTPPESLKRYHELLLLTVPTLIKCSPEGNQ